MQNAGRRASGENYDYTVSDQGQGTPYTALKNLPDTVKSQIKGRAIADHWCRKYTQSAFAVLSISLTLKSYRKYTFPAEDKLPSIKVFKTLSKLVRKSSIGIRVGISERTAVKAEANTRCGSLARRFYHLFPHKSRKKSCENSKKALKRELFCYFS